MENQIGNYFSQKIGFRFFLGGRDETRKIKINLFLGWLFFFFVDLFKLSVSVDMSRSSVHVAAAALCLPGIVFLLGFSDITATIAELFGQLVKYILET